MVNTSSVGIESKNKSGRGRLGDLKEASGSHPSSSPFRHGTLGMVVRFLSAAKNSEVYRLLIKRHTSDYLLLLGASFHLIFFGNKVSRVAGHGGTLA